MNIEQAKMVMQGYISVLNEIKDWFEDATEDDLQQRGEYSLEEYKQLITDWEVSESWEVIDGNDQLWNEYQSEYRLAIEQIPTFDKQVEEANQPLTRWDIQAMKADDRYDEMRAEEVRDGRYS
jgi:hypothetical protein